jgi:hypothetical protein
MLLNTRGHLPKLILDHSRKREYPYSLFFTSQAHTHPVVRVRNSAWKCVPRRNLATLGKDLSPVSYTVTVINRNSHTVSGSQSYQFSGLCSSSGILISRKHIVSETESVSILRWVEGDTLWSSLERANLTHWTQQSRCIPPVTWRLKQIQFPKRCVF